MFGNACGETDQATLTNYKQINSGMLAAADFRICYYRFSNLQM
jgi:hypothetical protein